jgi:hypothetical protein
MNRGVQNIQHFLWLRKSFYAFSNILRRRQFVSSSLIGVFSDVEKGKHKPKRCQDRKIYFALH